MTKFEEIKNILKTDYFAAELKFSIFVSALKNYKRDFHIRPFPTDFIDKDGVKNFDKLNDVVDKVPNFENLLTCDSNTIDNDVLNLLHFVLTSKEYQLKSIPKNEFPEVLQRSPSVIKVVDPKYIFKVIYEESNAEKKFLKQAEDCPTNFAYHGTKFFNLHSILNFGLQQHLNKFGLFGEGLYLSHEISVSLPFSPAGLGWKKAKTGELLSCVTLCEYVDDPVHVKVRKNVNVKNSDIPEKYLLISNNDCVRIRYLLVYSHRSQTKRKIPVEQNQIIAWCKKNFLVVSLIFYALILLLIGMSNSRSGEYYKQVIFTKIYEAFETLQNTLIRK